MPTKVRIKSEDGRFAGTSVIDVETGKQIPRVASIILDGDISSFWRAKIELLVPQIDVVADAEFIFIYLIEDLHKYRMEFQEQSKQSPEQDRLIQNFIEFINKKLKRNNLK